MESFLIHAPYYIFGMYNIIFLNIVNRYTNHILYTCVVLYLYCDRFCVFVHQPSVEHK
jgi:hypothetical protein